MVNTRSIARYQAWHLREHNLANKTSMSRTYQSVLCIVEELNLRTGIRLTQPDLTVTRKKIFHLIMGERTLLTSLWITSIFPMKTIINTAIYLVRSSCNIQFESARIKRTWSKEIDICLNTIIELEEVFCALIHHCVTISTYNTNFDRTFFSVILSGNSQDFNREGDQLLTCLQIQGIRKRRSIRLSNIILRCNAHVRKNEFTIKCSGEETHFQCLNTISIKMIFSLLIPFRIPSTHIRGIQTHFRCT